MESEPFCDHLLPLAFQPTDTGLQAYASLRDIAYKVKFLIVVNLVATRTILVLCDIQVDTLSPRGPALYQPASCEPMCDALSNHLDIKFGWCTELGTRHGKLNSNEN